MFCPTCGAPDAAGHFCTRCGAAFPVADAAPATGVSRAAAAPLPPRTVRRRLASVGIGCVGVAMAACVAFLVVASVPDPVALGLSVVAAIVPAAVYSWVVVRLDHNEAEPRRILVAAFAWGAVGAVLFSIIAGVLFQAILITAVAEQEATFFSATIGAPLIEETFKGVALLAILVFARDELDNVLDGIVYGALVGLGFAMTENILYFGAAYLEDGAAGLGRLFVVRAVVDGFGHAAYTATTGAGVGWARRQYRRGGWRFFVPFVGWALAVGQHFLWNAGIFVVPLLQGDDATVWSVVLVEAPLFLLPALVVLVVIARVARRREMRILHDQLAAETAGGVLTPAEHETLTSDGRRRQALAAAQRRGGRALRARQRRFFQVTAELAFRKYHLSRGERPKPGQRAPEDAYRAELAAIRTELAAAGVSPPTGDGSASP